MPTYSATREIVVPGPPGGPYGVLLDYEHLPEWQSRIVDCRVLSRDSDGRGSEVEYAIDVILRTVRYRVRHLYEPDRRIATEYLGGDFRHFGGAYRFSEHPDGTCVSLTLEIDPGLRIPGRLARTLNETVMGRSLDELRRRVIAVAPHR